MSPIDHLNLIDPHNPDHIFRHGSNFGLNLTDLKRDFLVATVKTLSMLFIYFIITSPLYISAIVFEYSEKRFFYVSEFQGNTCTRGLTRELLTLRQNMQIHKIPWNLKK